MLINGLKSLHFRTSGTTNGIISSHVLTPEYLVHGVDVADGLRVEKEGHPENPELSGFNNLSGP